MYYSLHTTEMAQHHTGDIKYGQTQKRQTGDKNCTIVGRKSSRNWKISLRKKIIGRLSGQFQGIGQKINIKINISQCDRHVGDDVVFLHFY